MEGPDRNLTSVLIVMGLVAPRLAGKKGGLEVEKS